MRTGIAPDGSQLLPGVPLPLFHEDDEGRHAGDPGLSRNAGARREPQQAAGAALAVWLSRPDADLERLYFKPGLFEPDQSQSAAWNRGGYLVTGLGHCGACHTPKNYFGADKTAQALSGNEVGGWYAPRLDGAARTGLKSWSVEDITEYLQSGRNVKSHAGGLMAEVVVSSTSKMSDADVRAIADYLKSLPPSRRETIVTPPDEAEMKAGQAVYAKLCIACHEADGSGAPRIYPPLPGNALLQSVNPSSTLAHHPRRRPHRDDAARAQHRRDAGLCQAIVRRRDRRSDELHPQFLGQRRAAGDAGAGGEGAEGSSSSPPLRHCERSEAIQILSAERSLDCFAALAMTALIERKTPTAPPSVNTNFGISHL